MMRNSTTNHTTIGKKGITLLELTTVILVLMVMISVLLIGANAYKNGVDRAQCVVNIRTVQVAVRSYQNMNVLQPGDEINQDRLINQDGGFLPALPLCPGQGEYSLATEIPELGDLALNCSVTTDGAEHTPHDYSDW